MEVVLASHRPFEISTTVLPGRIRRLSLSHRSGVVLLHSRSAEVAGVNIVPDVLALPRPPGVQPELPEHGLPARAPLMGHLQHCQPQLARYHDPLSPDQDPVHHGQLAETLLEPRLLALLLALLDILHQLLDQGILLRVVLEDG